SRELEYTDNEAIDIAAPVGHRVARSSLDVNRHGNKDAIRVEIGKQCDIWQHRDDVVVASSLQRRAPRHLRSDVDAIDGGGLWLGRIGYRKVFVALRRRRQSAIRAH